MHYELHTRYFDGVPIQVQYFHVWWRNLFSYGYWSSRYNFYSSDVNDATGFEWSFSDEFRFHSFDSIHNQHQQIVMSKTRSFKRHLNPQKVWLANQVAEEKIKIARQVVLDRAKKDAAFAADVLKAVGDGLPKEIKEACEVSVAAGVPDATEPVVGGGLTANRSEERRVGKE